MSKLSKWVLFVALAGIPTIGYAVARYHMHRAVKPHCHCDKK